jgi:uncharacterized membrane protein YfcA
MSWIPGVQDLLAVLSGGLVGFSLGLIGGGGSILAVPLLVHVVGVASPHVAIGTSAIAVAASAAINLFGHARARTVKWPCAIVFALAGVVGAAVGAAAGKMVDGQRLLALFGALMLAIGLLTLLPRRAEGDANVRLTRSSARRLLPRLTIAGFVVGALSGFFGIGGGFLIVPGLIGATMMPLLDAIGSSLVSVTTFGATTATSYALSGLVNWRIAVFLIAGGAVGGSIGVWLGTYLANYKRALSYLFATVVVSVGTYVMGAALLTASG